MNRNDCRCRGCTGATFGVEDRPMTKGERVFDILVATPVDWLLINYPRNVLIGAIILILLCTFRTWADMGFTRDWLEVASRLYGK